MEFLLNELSLCGQFENVEEFWKSIKPVITCIKIIREIAQEPIYKTDNFYECKVTKEEKLRDLKKCGNTDELLRFKLILDREIYSEPKWDIEPHHDLQQKFIWDGKDVTATALAEAAVRKDALLSFKLEEFKDCMLIVQNGGETYQVDSVHTPQYLLERYRTALKVGRKLYLKIKYEGTRIDCSTLEADYDESLLEKPEFASLVKSLDVFIKLESWEAVEHHKGLNYKEYTPSSKKKNWFLGSKYEGKTIMKFRFSDVRRAFGYRDGDTFKLLRLERDHTVSDNG